MANRLFPAPRPRKRKPRRPNRVLANLTDAGECYREYTCPTCRLEWHPLTTREHDEQHYAHWERYGTSPDIHRMCPVCNPPEVFEAWDVTPDPIPVNEPRQCPVRKAHATLDRAKARGETVDLGEDFPF